MPETSIACVQSRADADYSFSPRLRSAKGGGVLRERQRCWLVHCRSASAAPCVRPTAARMQRILRPGTMRRVQHWLLPSPSRP